MNIVYILKMIYVQFVMDQFYKMEYVYSLIIQLMIA